MELSSPQSIPVVVVPLPTHCTIRLIYNFSKMFLHSRPTFARCISPSPNEMDYRTYRRFYERAVQLSQVEESNRVLPSWVVAPSSYSCSLEKLLIVQISDINERRVLKCTILLLHFQLAPLGGGLKLGSVIVGCSFILVNYQWNLDSQKRLKENKNNNNNHSRATPDNAVNLQCLHPFLRLSLSEIKL